MKYNTIIVETGPSRIILALEPTEENNFGVPALFDFSNIVSASMYPKLGFKEKQTTY